MQKIKLDADERGITKKKVKSLRHDGTLPAAIFGYKGNFNIQLSQDEFKKVFAEAEYTAVVDIDLNGTNHSVLIDEVQINPLTREFTHVSLREVRMDVEITAEVPFTLIGAEESPAVKDEESLIILSQNEIELRGLPRDIPQELTIDVSGFHAGDTVVLKDIKLPEGISFVHDDEEALEAVIVTTASAIQEEIIEDVDAASAEAVGEQEVDEEGNPIPAAEGEEKPAEGEATEEAKE